MDDTYQSYNPVNSEELELLGDYRDVPAEDKGIIRSMLKRFKVGRQSDINQQAMAV